MATLLRPITFPLLLAAVLAAAGARAAPAASGTATAPAKQTTPPANAAACQACHGAAGEGQAAAGFPRLAGQGAAYLLRQLNAFASGQRESTVMTPIAKGLAPADRNALATHYAALAAPAVPAASPSTSGGGGRTPPRAERTASGVQSARAQLSSRTRMHGRVLALAPVQLVWALVSLPARGPHREWEQATLLL